MKPAPVAIDLDLLLEKKPMARADRVTLFEREVRERLSVPAIEILLERAKVLSEGRRANSPTAQRAYFGSTMMTLDVAALKDVVRDPLDARAAARVAELIRGDARVTRRVQRIAEREAQRLADSPTLGPSGAAGGAERSGIIVRAADVRVRAQGTLIYLDVDVEE